MSVPKILHHVFLGRMPDAEARYVREACLLHPTWKYHFWNQHNMDEVLPKSAPRFNCPAAMSNVIRLYAVNRFGGVYLDADCEVLKPFDDILLIQDAFAADQGDGRLCNAIWGARAGHGWLKWQISNIDQLSEDAATGPYLMTAAPRDGVKIVPTPWLYPFHFDDPPEKRKPHPESYCIHHWHGSWTKKAATT